MKRLLSGLAVSLLAFGVPTSVRAADQYVRTVQGTCGFTVANDITPGGQLGGAYVWNGVVYLAYETPIQGGVPTSGTVTCELKVNGVSQGTVLGPTSGTGPIVDAATIQFTAAVSDTVELCANISIDGTPLAPDCRVAVAYRPQGDVDATACYVFVALAPLVDGLRPDLLYIDPIWGDVYVLGNLFWDCPPYSV